MSKLSAKELANRGHMFLANGDKRKSAVIAQQQKNEASQLLAHCKHAYLMGIMDLSRMTT